MRFTRIEAGTDVLGRFVGVTRPEEESEGHWIVEGVEGRVHVVPESAALGEWRSSERLEPGDVVSLRGVRLVSAEGGGRTVIQPLHHGRLEEIEAAPVGVTVLDLEAIRPLGRCASLATLPGAGTRGFSLRWRDALERRRALLERAGMLGAGALGASPEREQARSLDELEREVEARMKQRLRTALTFDEVQRLFPGREIEHARRIAGGLYRGPLVGLRL